MSGGPPLAPAPLPDNDPTNATVFVGGIDSTATEASLKTIFDAYGDVTTVRIPLGRGCAFVTFTQKYMGQNAIDALHNQMIGLIYSFKVLFIDTYRYKLLIRHQ